MAKSFFERLTGSVRLNEETWEPPEQKLPASRSGRMKQRRDLTEEREPILHPVAADRSSGGGEASGPEPGEEGQLTVDIYDDGANIVIQSTVAGVRPEDIDISLQDDTLTIRGSRKRSHEVDEENFYYKELYWGTFSRSIILPEEVDFQKAEAALKNGLLTVRLPKKDRGEKKITVKVG